LGGGHAYAPRCRRGGVRLPRSAVRARRQDELRNQALTRAERAPSENMDAPQKFVPRKGPAPHVLAVVLAGGEGRRLWPLTVDRAKPAVPMAGRYRLVDFVLSNFVNSGLLKIKVLTQYKSDSLNSHIARGWRLPAFLDLYVEAVPAQQGTGPA